MDHRTHHGHGQRSDPHAGHQMSHEHRSHDRHEGHSVAMFRDKFWLSFALTIPTVFWSPEVQHWLVAIPVAGGLFVRWGFDLPMSVGAVAMSASTIIVAINAQLLRHLKLRRESL